MTSPFLERPPSTYVAHNHLAFAIRDAFPVSDGHTLVVPFREVPTWFEATVDEQHAIMALVDEVKLQLDAELDPPPDGYNIGINVGEAAGQTVFHLHVHVIPRYSGDVDDPRGGVRHVIPEKANYLGVAEAVVPYSTTRRGGRLVEGELDALLPLLRSGFRTSVQVDICVAFVMRSGIEAVRSDLRQFIDRGGELRLLTGDYLGITDPYALRELLDLQSGATSQVTLRVFRASVGPGFHPKAYIFRSPKPLGGVAFVGSSNLSDAALRTSVEWNYRVVPDTDERGFKSIEAGFERVLGHEAVRPLTHAWVDEYEARRPVPRAVDAVPDPVLPAAEPHEVQVEALDALELTRTEGAGAGLVVLATGLGKTWLAAFDSERFERVLFVAHREEILSQAMATFRRIRPNARLGYFTGSDKDPDADVVFASIQTLSRHEHMVTFERTQFDYIVVDEFHHASAASYRRVLDHFEPRFLLGLTATPERSDGGNLLALCQENLVYLCGMEEGIARGLLSPFHYFGVPDEVDYDNIPWRSTRFDAEILTAHLATHARAQNALDNYRARGASKGLGFCCSRAHADFMAGFFGDAGVRSVAVHSGPTSAPRSESLERLARGELDIVFAVDMFNEGVDLPTIDTVLMLRPTESRVLWMQQFGRGLRRAPGKERLVVIDYIGNHRTFLAAFEAVLGVPSDAWAVREAVFALRQSEGVRDLPAGCRVTYDLEALDVLEKLARVSKKAEAFSDWFGTFAMTHGRRPSALEAYHGGFSPNDLPKAVRPWFKAVRKFAALSEEEAAALANSDSARLLDAVESTRMNKSYKMVLLRGWIDHCEFPRPAGLDDLVEGFRRVARRAGGIALDVSVDLDDTAALRRLVEANPITYLLGVKSGLGELLTWSGEELSLSAELDPASGGALRPMLREIVEWRLGTRRT